MYKIGFIDDEEKVFRNYERKFRNYNRNKVADSEKVDFIRIDIDSDFSKIVQSVLDNKIECLLIDNKIIPETGENFIGTELLTYINSKISDLPCIILTSWIDDAQDSELVIKPLIFDKQIMTKEVTSEIFKDFIDTIEHSIKVFRKRIEINFSEYNNIYKRYVNNEEISSKDYESLIDKHKLLISYGLIEDVPIESLNKTINNKLDKLIKDVTELLGE